MIRILLFALLGTPLAWPAEPAMVFLVRHAERVGAQVDSDPLTEVGRQRAVALARVLGEADVAAILVSDTLRTQQTAEPLANKLSLTPVIAPRTTIPGLAAAITKAAVPGRTLVVIRHSNEVPAVVEALGGPKQPPMSELEYDRMIVITLVDGKPLSVRTLRYGR